MHTSTRLELLTPASSQRLVSLAHARGMLEGLGISIGEALIDAASESIAQYCGRSFGRATWRETWSRAYGAPLLTLTHWVAPSLISVIEDGVTLTLATDVALDDKTGILTRLDTGEEPTAWRANKVVVTYQAGYVLPDHGPHDLRQACVRLVASWDARRQIDPTLRSESVDGVGSRSYLDPRSGGGALPDEVTALIDPYRVVRTA